MRENETMNMNAVMHVDTRTDAEKRDAWRKLQRARFVCETAARSVSACAHADLLDVVYSLDAAEALATEVEKRGVAFWLLEESLFLFIPSESGGVVNA